MFPTKILGHVQKPVPFVPMEGMPPSCNAAGGSGHLTVPRWSSECGFIRYGVNWLDIIIDGEEDITI